MPDLSHGAVAIIGYRIDQKRDAAGTITLISNLFVIDAFLFTCAAPNRAVYGVVWHVAGFRVRDCFPQARVGVGITTAGTRRHGDLFDELSEELAALGIQRTLLVFDTMPLRMSGHRKVSLV